MNHVLDGGSDPPCDGAIIREEGAARCKLQSLTAMSIMQRSHL